MILTIQQVCTFALVFARLVVMLLLSPFFSDKEIPAIGKVIFLFWLSGLLIFYVPLPVHFPVTPITFFFALFIEFLVGAILGYISQILLLGIEFAGSLMDTQAGLSVASTLDPSSGQTTTLLSKLMRQIGVLVFLLIDGHHVILGTIVQSFQAVPIGGPMRLQKAAEFVVLSSTHLFEITLQLSAPILLVVFFIDFGFGMLSRVAPQVNVFQLGFQLKPIVSIIVFLTIVPGLVDLIYYLLEKTASQLLQTLMLMR